MPSITLEDIPNEPRNPLLTRLLAKPVARVGPAQHGQGLFATEPLHRGQVAASYPFDFILGETTFYYAWADYGDRMPSGYAVRIDSDYFGGPVVAIPARREHAPFEHAHLINDVKLRPGIPTKAEYARDTRLRENVRLVNGGDLLVAEVTRPIAAGEELLTAYGWRYWAVPPSEMPRRAIDQAIFEVVRARVAAKAGASGRDRRHSTP